VEEARRDKVKDRRRLGEDGLAAEELVEDLRREGKETLTRIFLNILFAFDRTPL
jgi:hypothetical protein